MVIISCFYRYVRRFSAGQPPVSLLPLLRPFLKRLISKQRLLPVHRQPTAAHRHPQLREEVWLHAEGDPGVRLWWWHLHCLPYGLGKDYQPVVDKSWSIRSRQTVKVLYFICWMQFKQTVACLPMQFLWRLYRWNLIQHPRVLCSGLLLFVFGVKTKQTDHMILW